MQETTVRALTIARTLIDRASPLCNSDDRYQATAGLLILQDGLEIALLASLLEKEPGHKLDKVTDFDKLIGDLGAAGITIPKTGTLKLLNKTRGLSKHYGNLAEPTQVRGYFKSALQAIDAVLLEIGQTNLRGIFLSSMLEPGETREILESAERALSSGDYFDALVFSRKAFFVEFEISYSVFGWQNGMPVGLIAALQAGGWDAPSYARDPAWIAAHVKTPADYVQVNFDHLRMRSMEIGVSFADIQQVRARTPQVFRASRGADWAIAHAPGAPAAATEADARLCVDTMITAVLRKQTYDRAHPGLQRPQREQIVLAPGLPIYDLPDAAKAPIGQTRAGAVYVCTSVTSGFDPQRTFLQIYGAWSEPGEEGQPTRNLSIAGYVERP